MKELNFNTVRKLSYVVLTLGFLTTIIISFYDLLFSEAIFDILVTLSYIVLIGIPALMFFSIKKLYPTYKLNVKDYILLMSTLVVSLSIYALSVTLLVYTTLSDGSRLIAAMSLAIGSMFLFNAIELLLNKNNQLEKKS